MRKQWDILRHIQGVTYTSMPVSCCCISDTDSNVVVVRNVSVRPCAACGVLIVLDIDVTITPLHDNVQEDIC